MSGRLVISRHKRWHVWNQDNIKRVRDDEAKHAAEVEEKERKERQHMNEQSLTILKRQTGVDGDVASSSSSSCIDDGMASVMSKRGSSTGERFSLFEDPSFASSGNRTMGNKNHTEYDKEEEVRKKKMMIANGMQLWSFDDVTSGLKPWYNTGSTSTESFPTESVRMNIAGKEMLGEEAKLARRRDHFRKDFVDPMAHIIKSSHDQEVVVSNRSNTKICNAYRRGETCKYGDSCRYLHGVDNEIYPKMHHVFDKKELVMSDSSSELSSSSCTTEDKERHSKKRKKKRKKHKKERSHNDVKKSNKRKKIKKPKSESRTREREQNFAECPICFEERELNNSLGDCEHYICDNCHDQCGHRCPMCRGTKKAELERSEMRLRRLERENAERRRSNVLLAENDAFSNRNGINIEPRQNFHQMYNPHLS